MAKYQMIGGLHSVKAVLKHGAESVDTLWVERRRHDQKIKDILDLADESGITVQTVDKAELEHLVPGVNHQGVVARTQVPTALSEKQLPDLLANKTNLLLLILDGVQDPHNLGACLRSADGAGVDLVIAPKDRSVGLTPVVCKVACGGAESVPFVQVTNLARTLKWLQREQAVWLVGTAGEAESDLYDVDLKGNVGIVMGGEEKGLRRLTRENCDRLVKLPMVGGVESLNVSVAAGVCLFEAVRQRRH